MDKPTLEDAIALALAAHHGQRDKGQGVYVLHPLRVMLAQTSDDARMAGVLHDTCEDAGITLDDLRARGYPEHVVAAVDALTRRREESYPDFIQRVKENPLARKVKLADLEDNLDVRRLTVVDEAARERLERYRAAWLALQ